jgi:hypothetical protein
MKILGNIFGILTVCAASTIMLLHAIVAQSTVSRRIALLRLLYQRRPPLST